MGKNSAVKSTHVSLASEEFTMYLDLFTFILSLSYKESLRQIAPLLFKANILYK